MASTSQNSVAGYYLLSADGGLFSFGDVTFPGTPAAAEPGCTWSRLARWPRGGGLVAMSADGAVCFLGGPSGLDDDVSPREVLGTAEPVDLEVLPRGLGYWVVDRAGGIFSFGDAPYFGSVPGLVGVDAGAVVDMASTPTGAGYWILDAVGGVFAFGDAEYHGSIPSLRLDEPWAPAIAIHPSGTGGGYVIVDRSGVLRSFGDAPAVPDARSSRDLELVACAAARDGLSFVGVDLRGLVYPIGNGPMLGSAAALQLTAPIVDIEVVLTTRAPSAT